MANKKNGMSKESLTLILIFEMMLGLLFLLAFKGGGEYAMIFFIFVYGSRDTPPVVNLS